MTTLPGSPLRYTTDVEKIEDGEEKIWAELVQTLLKISAATGSKVGLVA
jgi:hypothetical protein